MMDRVVKTSLLRVAPWAVVLTFVFFAPGVVVAAVAPDIESSFVGVSYNSGTGNFLASGYPLTIDLDGVAPPDYPIGDSQSFQIQFTGGNVATATLDILGSIGSPLNVSDGLLLHGTFNSLLVDYTGASNPVIFNFKFNVNNLNSAIGGALAALFGPTVGVTLNAGTLTAIPFTASFQNDGISGVADTFAVVPEPGSAVVALLGGLALVCRNRLSRRSRA